ncbi:restriction endonuclease subunit S [Pseudomonas sp. IT-P176]|uniref:restriction endonuclease subunit S n=1 Tax=Pseudomonas sp. IT-P176 TaxID=3026444 RepID=UPI0039E054A3
MAGRYQTYLEYKDSGVEWLGLIPDTWSTTPLKCVTNFINGNAFKPSEWSEDGVPIIRIENLNGSHDFNCFEGRVDDRYRVLEGDLLFGWSGNRGTSFGPFLWWRTGEHYLNQHIFKLDEYSCNKQWLYWTLKAVTYYVEEQAHGVIGMVHVTKGKLGGIRIPCIDRLEQVKIANFLDHETAKIGTLIEKQTQLIQLLKEKRQAAISQAVTKGLNSNAEMRESGVEWLGKVPRHWVVGRYKFCTTRIVVGIAEAATHAYTDSGVPIIRSTNIKEEGLDTTGMLFITEEFSEKNSSKYLYANDVITVRTGYPGVSAVIPEQLNNSQCFTNLVATPSKAMLPEFLSEYLNSHTGKSYFDLLGWGSAQKNISVPILQNIPIAYPNNSEQRTITEFIKKQRRKYTELIDKAEEQILLLEERRTALISAAITGKIDVRHWVAPKEIQTNREVAA